MNERDIEEVYSIISVSFPVVLGTKEAYLLSKPLS